MGCPRKAKMVLFRWALDCARPLASVTSGEIFKLQGRTKAPQETPRRRRDKPKDGPLSHREHPKSAAKRAPRRKSRGAPDRHAPLQAPDRGPQRGHHLQQETAPQEKKLQCRNCTAGFPGLGKPGSANMRGAPEAASGSQTRVSQRETALQLRCVAVKLFRAGGAPGKRCPPERDGGGPSGA